MTAGASPHGVPPRRLDELALTTLLTLALLGVLTLIPVAAGALLGLLLY